MLVHFQEMNLEREETVVRKKRFYVIGSLVDIVETELISLSDSSEVNHVISTFNAQLF